MVIIFLPWSNVYKEYDNQNQMNMKMIRFNVGSFLRVLQKIHLNLNVQETKSSSLKNQ